MWRIANLSSLLIAVLALCSCNEQKEKDLPLLGPYEVTDEIINGKLVTDTVFSSIKPFDFVNQEGVPVNHATIDSKVYVADFFFTSCPTICPKMKQQLLRVHEEFKDAQDFVILSHSIDPKRDSVGRLKSYADKLGIDANRWHLLTGEKSDIYDMAKHYMIAAQEDDLAPGGFAHSGAFLLIDKNKQVRGIYDGTLPEEVDQMMEDLKWLLANEG